jgi:acetyl esterase/lipase
MRRSRILVLAAWGLALVLGAISARAAIITPNITVNSPGAVGDAVLIDLFRPSNNQYPGEYTVILLHGGNYCCGDKFDLRSLAIALADRGYAVISANYTLSAPNSPSFPQPIIDVMNIMRWVRTDGVTMGVPDRIVLGGHSAGATIALTTAMVAQSDTTLNFQNLPPADRRGFVVDGAVGISGRYDIFWNASVGVPGTVVQYLGTPVGTPGWQSLYQSASAVTYVNPCSPPTVLIHGSNDNIVPLANSQRLASMLQTAQIPVQLDIVPGGSHDITIAGATPALQSQRIAQAVQFIAAFTTDICGRTNPGPIFGSCCDSTGACASTIFADCPALTSWRAGVVCAPNPCPQPGACCDDANGCTMTLIGDCAPTSSWRPAASCTPTSCEPLGSCCDHFGICEIRPASSCELGFLWTAGGVCGPTSCPQPGICCQQINCFLIAQFACDGMWRGPGTCVPASCNDFFENGVCCRGATCEIVPGFACTGLMTRFTSSITQCNAPGNAISPCHHADFNKDNTVTVQDVFDFLSRWFAGDLMADIAGNGTGAPTVQSIFTFLAAWFVG